MKMDTKYFELADAKRDGLFNIGQAAEASGVSAKMIRHYEENGFIPKAGRTVAGYRIYRDADVHLLKFIRRAQELGFKNLADVWKSKYDQPGAEFEKDMDRVWTELKPLYQQLHCYVRTQLNRKYGDAVVPRTGPIPERRPASFT